MSSLKLADVVSKSFPPADGEWKTINCLRETETRHAATANFISWQEWLHAVKSHEEDAMKGKNQQDMDKNSRSHTGCDEAEDSPVSLEIRNIISKISLETGVKGLTASESDLLNKACADFPRIRQLRRMAHIHHTRSAMGRAMARADQKTAIDPKKTMSSIKSRVLDHATRWKRWTADNPWRFAQAFGTAAVTACLIIWMTLPGASGRLETMINQSYQAGYFQRTQLAKHHYDLPWETPSTAYGFAGGSQPTDANRAFGAGLWTGRRMLRKSDAAPPLPDFLTPDQEEDQQKAEAWSNTQWNPYYQMGKWCFLIYAVSHEDHHVPVSFWENQVEIVERLREVYAEAPRKGGESGGVVAASLNALASEFGGLKKIKNPSTRKIAFEIKNLIVYLSPGFLPDNKNETSSSRF